MVVNPTIETLFHSVGDVVILRTSLVTMFGPKLPGEIIVDEIEEQCGRMEGIYTSAVRFFVALRSWANANRVKWEKLKASTEFEYNPISNYNRDEEYTTEKVVEDVNTGFGVNVGKSKHTESGSGETKTADSVAAFNSDTHTPKGETVVTGSNSGENNGESRNETFTDTSGTNTSVEKHTAKISGNNGLAVQKLIDEERRIVRYVFINEIVEDFKRRFCLLCYDV